MTSFSTGTVSALAGFSCLLLGPVATTELHVCAFRVNPYCTEAQGSRVVRDRKSQGMDPGCYGTVIGPGKDCQPQPGFCHMSGSPSGGRAEGACCELACHWFPSQACVLPTLLIAGMLGGLRGASVCLKRAVSVLRENVQLGSGSYLCAGVRGSCHLLGN